MAARKRGFTLVELLVVMSIIAALTGLLLPAVQAAREAARRNTCMNNMRNFAQALNNYENGRKSYPGYTNLVGGRRVTYVVSVLPLIERTDLYKVWSDSAALPANANVYMALAICPSNPGEGSGTGLSYIVNSGRAEDLPSSATPAQVATLTAAAGMFVDRTVTTSPRITAEYISANDGLGTTLMVSENMLPTSNWAAIDTAGTPTHRVNTTFVWYTTQNTTAPITHTINADKYNPPANPTLQWARPASAHPGGVNVCFADTHTRFIGDDIEYAVYKQLMTPNGSQASRTIAAIPPGVADVDLTTPIDESRF